MYRVQPGGAGARQTDHEVAPPHVEVDGRRDAVAVVIGDRRGRRAGERFDESLEVYGRRAEIAVVVGVADVPKPVEIGIVLRRRLERAVRDRQAIVLKVADLIAIGVGADPAFLREGR